MRKIATAVMLVLVIGFVSIGSRQAQCADQPAASQQSVKVLKEVPKTDVGMKTNCAVCKMAMTVKSSTPVVEYAGKRYYFCDPSEVSAFTENPSKFAH
ncbi:MAG TPA: hypothetical protein VEF03_08615 [Candidatus Binataceae bacterium]|nr:hypothetical protein [Candidatus Binataceae bacterium]